MLTLTDNLIRAGQTNNGGWNKKQLHLLGISWPPTKGWKLKVIGQEITEEHYEEFLSLKNKRFKKKKRRQPSFFDDNKEFNQEVWAHLNAIYDEQHKTNRSITFGRSL